MTLGETLRGKPPVSLAEALLFHGWVVTKNGCWEWAGGRTPKGYGTLSNAGKTLRAHRVSYEYFLGPLRHELVVRHRCDNPPCVNPEHLEAGTIKDNVGDRVSRGRSVASENSPHAKLNWDAVKEIRTSSKSLSKLATHYDVSTQAIWLVKQGRTWKER